jgi:hypothetical protein
MIRDRDGRTFQLIAQARLHLKGVALSERVCLNGKFDGVFQTGKSSNRSYFIFDLPGKGLIKSQI